MLDASALLSLLNKEPGWEVVARHVVNQHATISAVNYCEVVQKAAQLGVVAEDIDANLDRLAITISPFSLVNDLEQQREERPVSPAHLGSGHGLALQHEELVT